MAAEVKVGPIVVGIDGSPPSLDALRWAAAQALLQKSDLHIVVAWHMPNMFGWAVLSQRTSTPSSPLRQFSKMRSTPSPTNIQDWWSKPTWRRASPPGA